jgi:hypothetical protein
MSVRLHAIVFMLASALIMLGGPFFIASVPTGVQALVPEVGLGELGPQVGNMLSIGSCLAIGLLWFFGVPLFSSVFNRFIPAQCQKPGCTGTMRLTQGTDSFVYDTHFQIGGDD